MMTPMIVYATLLADCSQQVDPSKKWFWVFPLISAIGGVLGAFFGTYLSKSGEIAAIQKNIGTVVEQNKKIFFGTEQIRTGMAERTWADQRHWEIMRDTAISIMRGYASTLWALNQLMETASRQEQVNSSNDVELKKKAGADYDGAYDRFSKSMQTFWELEEISRLAFSLVVHQEMKVMEKAFNDVAMEIMADAREIKRFSSMFKDLSEKQSGLSQVVRTELHEYQAQKSNLSSAAIPATR